MQRIGNQKNTEVWQQPSGLKPFETAVPEIQRKSVVASLNKAVSVLCFTLRKR